MASELAVALREDANRVSGAWSTFARRWAGGNAIWKAERCLAESRMSTCHRGGTLTGRPSLADRSWRWCCRSSLLEKTGKHVRLLRLDLRLLLLNAFLLSAVSALEPPEDVRLLLLALLPLLLLLLAFFFLLLAPLLLLGLLLLLDLLGFLRLTCQLRLLPS